MDQPRNSQEVPPMHQSADGIPSMHQSAAFTNDDTAGRGAMDTEIPEYTYRQEEEVTWPEFLESNKDKFPLLVYIVGGHDGYTIYDDFCSDQVYRVHTYTNQRRVVAKVTKMDDPFKDVYLTIPVNTNVKFCVNRGHRSVEEPKCLEQILQERTFPIPVTFSSDVSDIYEGSHREDKWTYATVLLTREYTENFLLGHCVLAGGKIHNEMVMAAVTDKISVALVTGIKGKSAEYFRKHLSTMSETIAGATYDRTRGNPGISEITRDGTGTGNSLPNIVPPLLPTATPPPSPSFHGSDDSTDDMYAAIPLDLPPVAGPRLPPRAKDLPPRLLSTGNSLPNIVPSLLPIATPPPSPSPHGVDDSTDDMYTVPLDLPFVAGPRVPPRAKDLRPRDKDLPPPTKDLPPRKRSPHAQKAPEHDAVTPESNVPKRKEVRHGKPQGGALHEKHVDGTHARYADFNQLIAIEAAMKKNQSAFQEPEKSGHAVESNQQIVTKNIPVHPENLETAKPIPQIPEIPRRGESERVVKMSPNSDPGNIKREIQQSSVPEHLTNLSVKDIGDKLRTLNLGKYVDRFAADMIDGVLLAELTKENLKEAFELGPMEQIRLWKFISEGHIPK